MKNITGERKALLSPTGVTGRPPWSTIPASPTDPTLFHTNTSCSRLACLSWLKCSVAFARWVGWGEHEDGVRGGVGLFTVKLH